MKQNVFARVSFGKWSKQADGSGRNFDHGSPTLSASCCKAAIQRVTMQTPHSVTVAALTGSLDCLVIQLKQSDPKNPPHISIMVLTEHRDAPPPPPGNTRSRVICMSITSEKPVALDMRRGEPI